MNIGKTMEGLINAAFIDKLPFSSFETKEVRVNKCQIYNSYTHHDNSINNEETRCFPAKIQFQLSEAQWLNYSTFRQYPLTNASLSKYKNIDLPALTLSANNQLQCLSKREFEITNAVASGETTADIAKKLFISRRTVEAHRAKIFKKLEIKSVARLAQLVLLSNIYITINKLAL